MPPSVLLLFEAVLLCMTWYCIRTVGLRRMALRLRYHTEKGVLRLRPLRHFVVKLSNRSKRAAERIFRVALMFLAVLIMAFLESVFTQFGFLLLCCLGWNLSYSGGNFSSLLAPLYFVFLWNFAKNLKKALREQREPIRPSTA